MYSLMMTGLSVGIDITEIAPIAWSITHYGERFLNRIYTIPEQRYCRGRTRHFATLFAAKEAAAKALGTGLAYLSRTGVEFHDLQITADTTGRACLTLSGTAQARAATLGWTEWAVSLSASRMYAVALVVATYD